MTMCVECSAPIVILSGIYTALAFAQRRQNAYGALIPFLLFPYIFRVVGGLECYDI
jgi:hypothetical protein